MLLLMRTRENRTILANFDISTTISNNNIIILIKKQKLKTKAKSNLNACLEQLELVLRTSVLNADRVVAVDYSTVRR